LYKRRNKVITEILGMLRRASSTDWDERILG